MPHYQQYADLYDKKNGVEMQKMNVYRLLKNKLQKPVGDNVKNNHQLWPKGRNMAREQADNNNGNDGNIVKPSKNSNNLPQTICGKLQQWRYNKGKLGNDDAGALRHFQQ